MILSKKILNMLKTNTDSSITPHAQTIYFNNGKMYKV